MNYLKLIFVMSFLFISVCLASLNVIQDGKNLEFIFQDQDSETQQITIAYPAESINYEIDYNNSLFVDENGEDISDKANFIKNTVSHIDSFVMRELCGHTFAIQSTVEHDGKQYNAKSIRVRLNTLKNFAIPKNVSKAFLPVYKDIVSNFSTSYLRDAATTPEKMLIITPTSLQNAIHDFVIWKRQCGIHTDVFTLDDTGSTTQEIKSFIQNRYDNLETRPDYLLLIGDVDDSFALPAYYFSEENNVTDTPYTLLAGDDFFPEMLVGRFSIDSSYELATIINKVLRYEKMPYIDNSDWYNQAVLVAGNFSSTPPVPVTPVQVTQWLNDKLENYGFTDITEVYYPGAYPGTDQIVSGINNGASFVTYRGWGDANGWHYPYFHTENLDELNNGAMLPVMTSIVCNTGDFANSVDPCFGEACLRLGSPSSPNGMVAFVGPSDLHTSTKFNNAIFSGFYSGLLDENIFSFGSAVLRGKVELYNNYPLNLEPGGQVEFYFYVYNILGDPSLQMWSKTPQNISCSLPSEIGEGTNHLEIELSSNLNGAIISAIQGDELLDVSTLESGSATVYFEDLSSEDLTITITKENFEPFIQSISIQNDSNEIGIEDISPNNSILSGQTNSVSVTLHNYGSETASDVNATFSSAHPGVSISSPTINYGNINSSSAVSRDFEFTLMADCPDQDVIEFSVTINSGETHKFELIAGSINFSIQDHFVNDANGFMDPGEETEVAVTIKNISSVSIGSADVMISSQSDAVNVTSESVSIGSLNPDDTTTLYFNVAVEDDCYIGRSVYIQLHIVSDANLENTVSFQTHVGEIDNTAPQGPDDYGYFLFDSYDVTYSQAPSYFWEEIDPQEGGNGTVILMSDDQSENINLPFNFAYYGENFDEITVCSNGWISFETTWMKNFRNWGIPAALGPYGMVAAYWDDLIGSPNGDEFDPMRICYYYDSSANRFIIEWNETYNNFDDTSLEKFQLVLFDPEYYPTLDGNGEIQVNYHTINNPDATNNYVTIGIENLTQTDGIEYTFANQYAHSSSLLENGLAIKFTTSPPDSYTNSETDILSPIVNSLHNYPNPFNPETTIAFELSHLSKINVSIYNIKGALVKTLLNETLSAGNHTITWQGKDQKDNKVASGVYFYQLKINDKNQQMKKCILMK